MLSSILKRAEKLLHKRGLARRSVAALGALALCASTALTLPAQARTWKTGSNVFGFALNGSEAGDTGPAPTATPAPSPSAAPEHGKDRTDLAGFVHDVTITDAEGNPFDGKLYVGEEYRITLEFKEEGVQGAQFGYNEDGCMTYQIPKNFKVEPCRDVALSVQIGGETIELGTYSIDEDGLLTLHLTEEGKQALDRVNDLSIIFHMEATAQHAPDGGDNKLHFGDDGGDFTYEITDQPRVSMDKTGTYEEDADARGGLLGYTVKTAVEHGEIYGAVLSDTLTPPQTKALSLRMLQKDGEPDVTVTLTRGGETVTLAAGVDYDLVPTEPDPKNPYKEQTFQVKLRKGSAFDPLEKGDEVEVTYNYRVDYSEGATDVFWGNVVNEATFTGTMPVENPDRPGTYTDVPVEEHRKSSVEVYVTPPGHGVISKAQEYSEYTHTLHYTCYTVIPAGKWEPLFIQDDMVVEYNGQRWYIPEFKAGGRVKDLKVSAVDVKDWFNWDDSTDNSQKLQDMEALKASAKTLTGYEAYSQDMYDHYDPKNIDQYVYRLGDQTLNIIFGLDKERNYNEYWGKWGSWDYKTDRLIITEYDLDMSAGDITLKGMDGQAPITLSADDILLAGIKNNVNLRFGGYYPGFSVFFNNADKMNKTGKLNKEDNTIDYTVTINTTDSTVNGYFRDVFKDWFASRPGDFGWNYNSFLHTGMQAVFYDVLPEGWAYVPDSLYATARLKYGNLSSFDYNPDNRFKVPGGTPVKAQDGAEVLEAPLVLFYNADTSLINHELYNMFGSDLVELSFHYKLKATDEWLKKHGAISDDILVHNHAEIRDKNSTHWEADADVPYFPARLTKQAEQEGESNLLRFTLKVNYPAGADLDPEKDYLIVTDKSENLQIALDTIRVLDAEGHAVAFEQLPTDEEGKFKLKVPDSMALTIQYDALIPELGAAVKVSNAASIDGVARSDGDFEGSLVVNDIYGTGSGSVYTMSIKKVDSEDSTKTLAGAKFRFYILRKEGSDLAPSDPIGDYANVHTEEDWEFTTGDDGTFTIDEHKNWLLEQGNFYALVEEEAPEGYALPEEPLLFYYGMEDDEERLAYPDAPCVLPGGLVPLTVENTPVYLAALPTTGGPGTAGLYLAGGLLLAIGLPPLRRRKKDPAA